MKQIILFIVTFFLVSHYAYSQHVANAMPLDIPLNSTKESAVQKLLRYNYRLWDSYEKEGFKVLEYKREYNKKVIRLWLKSNNVSIVSWTLDYDESEAVLLELKDVYDYKPYAQIDKPDIFGDEQSYFYWNGKTIIVGRYELFILSNADAAKRYQKVIHEEQERKRQEQERKRQEQELKERERQEQIRKENERLEKERRDARVKELKLNYSSCRFLFATESSFVSCITQETPNAIETEIKTLIDQRMDEVSNLIVKGDEFKENSYVRTSLEGICNVSNSIVRAVSPTIANYAENKIEIFVANREELNEAYNEAKKEYPILKCSKFLSLYLKESKK